MYTVRIVQNTYFLQNKMQINTTPYFIVHTIIQVYTYTLLFNLTFGNIWTEFNNEYFLKQSNKTIVNH